MHPSLFEKKEKKKKKTPDLQDDIKASKINQEAFVSDSNYSSSKELDGKGKEIKKRTTVMNNDNNDDRIEKCNSRREQLK